ncbi:SCP2 sterol-binding domain-containing protein [Actinomycetospora soli]|uniref:SCP2 sterol-binding domain-containing protein n=1 Tax=Actinomycetospora soli TaxID=2893887 RepID=UPI001E52189A|nr:SCP2 sterol-binding domain-containing protein [Actinomycetospora soli]MCD2186994.1 SCP2 sterol-binding domain-containing protein [Actinomycetospora soli]
MVAAPTAMDTGRWFEDFAVGERFTSAGRPVTADDLAAFTRLSGDDHPLHAGPGAMLQGPFGIAVAMGLMQSLGLHGEAVQGLLDTHWHYRAPIRVGDVLHLELMILRARRTRSGTRGTVTRHMRLVGDDGATRQEGTTTALVAARTSGPDDDGRAFGTVGWGRAVVDALDPETAAVLETWDGTIGLRCDDDEVHLRVYRGAVIDVSRRAPHGATFTLVADAATWLELVEAPDNPLLRLAMTGRVSATGDGYEYLRLTRALHLIVDAARAIA